EEIIFRARSVDGRTQLTVDEKHVVALAPPSVLILQHGHGDSQEVATAGGLRPHVIAVAIQVFLFFDEPIGIQLPLIDPARVGLSRSEERRVGKECRSGWWVDQYI